MIKTESNNVNANSISDLYLKLNILKTLTQDYNIKELEKLNILNDENEKELRNLMIENNRKKLESVEVIKDMNDIYLALDNLSNTFEFNTIKKEEMYKMLLREIFISLENMYYHNISISDLHESLKQVSIYSHIDLCVSNSIKRIISEFESATSDLNNDERKMFNSKLEDLINNRTNISKLKRFFNYRKYKNKKIENQKLIEDENFNRLESILKVLFLNIYLKIEACNNLKNVFLIDNNNTNETIKIEASLNTLKDLDSILTSIYLNIKNYIIDNTKDSMSYQIENDINNIIVNQTKKLSQKICDILTEEDEDNK